MTLRAKHCTRPTTLREVNDPTRGSCLPYDADDVESGDRLQAGIDTSGEVAYHLEALKRLQYTETKGEKRLVLPRTDFLPAVRGGKDDKEDDTIGAGTPMDVTLETLREVNDPCMPPKVRRRDREHSGH